MVSLPDVLETVSTLALHEARFVTYGMLIPPTMPDLDCQWEALCNRAEVLTGSGVVRYRNSRLDHQW